MEGRTGGEKARIGDFFDVFADGQDEGGVCERDDDVFVDVSVLGGFDGPYSSGPLGGGGKRGMKEGERGGERG